jgi:hypothetical protein
MIDFGRPHEKEELLQRHKKFFNSLENIQKAIDLTFNRQGELMERADILIVILGNICFENFSAIMLLCLHGFGDDAFSLVRGMYERLVLSRHFNLHPEDVEAFWEFHLVKLRKLGLDDLLNKLDPSGNAIDRFIATHPHTGKKIMQRNWTKIDFVAMANEVGLGVHVRHAYRLPLEFAHPSVHGILQWLEVREDGGFDVKNEPNRYSVEMVLPIAHLLAIEVLRVQIEHFNLDANEPVFQQCLRDFEEAWPRRAT